MLGGQVHAAVASAFSLPAGTTFHFEAEDGSVFPVSAQLPLLAQGSSYKLVPQHNPGKWSPLSAPSSPLLITSSRLIDLA